MDIIDPHLHLFNLEQGQYNWLKPENPPFWPDKHTINQNFSEKDLQLNNNLTLKGFVHIEAGFDNNQPWREIAWLEKNCQRPFKTIAGINLLLGSKAFLAAVIQLKKYTCVVGVRDILDENAVSYLSNPQVIDNLKQLAEQQLIFELQMPVDNIEALALLTDILSSIPMLQVVINHAGLPPNQENSSAPMNKSVWWQSLNALSRYQQCSIKCSGFEMLNRRYDQQWQAHIIMMCINAFGAQRVMLASNFPLCLFTTSYQDYWQQLQQSILLSQAEMNDIYCLNAKRIYQF
ncbi:amidohydrolase [Colwelliaceae bacterium 6441]